MTAANIIPSHENVDIEVFSDHVALSQRIDGILESVRFHKRYIDDVIRALQDARGPSEHELMEAAMRREMEAVRREIGA